MACDCIAEIDAQLLERNMRIAAPIMFGPDQTSRVIIKTEQIEKGRGKKKAASMLSTYCPFCGIRHFEAQP